MNIEQCWYKEKCKNKCSSYCIRYNSIYSLFEHSNTPENMWNYKKLTCSKQGGDIDAYRKLGDIEHNISEFIEAGDNIYIFSTKCGNGKTSWAIRLMYAYFNSIWHKGGFDCKALFVNVPNFLYNCKRNISQTVKGFDDLCNLIERVDLVVWDDLPCGSFTGYEHQILYQYIDGRINAGKSNIYTGNENREGCSKNIGERLTSRIFGSRYIFEFVEEDKRGLR